MFKRIVWLLVFVAAFGFAAIGPLGTVQADHHHHHHHGYYGSAYFGGYLPYRAYYHRDYVPYRAYYYAPDYYYGYPVVYPDYYYGGYFYVPPRGVYFSIGF